MELKTTVPTCTRRLQFAAGHRVLGHESKCANVHGHNYVVHVTARGPLDGIGRVIDFSVLKEKVGGWIDRNWDHGFIAYDMDLHLLNHLVTIIGPNPGFPTKIHRMPTNPTAENMAEYLLREVCPLVLEGTGVTAIKVVVEETENCFAEAVLW